MVRQYPQSIVESATDDWEPAAAVTLWNRTTSHRIDCAWYQEYTDHLDVKIHTDQFASSGLPMSVVGCECLVSMQSETVRSPMMDAGPSECQYATVSQQRSSGNHIIVTLPD